MEYLWKDGLTAPIFAPLHGEVKTDVLIIGGGIAGMLCALELQSRGIDCIICEAKTIGSGVTRGTTAVLSAQHDTLYSKLSTSFSRHAARLYLDANLDAIRRFEALSSKYPCDFEIKDSYMYTNMSTSELEAEAECLNSLNFPAEFVTSTSLPVEMSGAVRYPGMAQFHPLKFLYQIAAELKIYENTKVLDIDRLCAKTEYGTVKARKFIVATHYPFMNLHGMYFMKLYQKRSFVLALENVPNVNGTYVDMAEGGMYFRNFNDLLIIGGGDKRPGTSGGGFEAVRRYVQANFPSATERYAWAAQDCMSLDGVPYIGRYVPGNEDIFVATGFNEWGMTSSMAASVILADLIEGKENEFAPVFSPERSMMRTQLAANLFETAMDFVIPTTKRCAHLGCALKWNDEEHSWDCPCHGSRFTESGAVIDGPAQRSAKID